MRNAVRTIALIVFAAALFGPAVRAQQSPVPPKPAAPTPPAPKEAPKPVVPLRVQIVLSRYDGEKKIASLPFTLSVNANDRATMLTMHTQVAVPNGPAVTGSPTVPITSFTYKAIGTTINCEATSLDDGRYRIAATVQDNSMLPDKTSATTSAVAGIPSFQDFTSSNVVILKDGQTAQYAAATDAVSGQVTKIDITLTVIK